MENSVSVLLHYARKSNGLVGVQVLQGDTPLAILGSGCGDAVTTMAEVPLELATEAVEVMQSDSPTDDDLMDLQMALHPYLPEKVRKRFVKYFFLPYGTEVWHRYFDRTVHFDMKKVLAYGGATVTECDEASSEAILIANVIISEMLHQTMLKQFDAVIYNEQITSVIEAAIESLLSSSEVSAKVFASWTAPLSEAELPDIPLLLAGSAAGGVYNTKEQQALNQYTHQCRECILKTLPEAIRSRAIYAMFGDLGISGDPDFLQVCEDLFCFNHDDHDPTERLIQLVVFDKVLRAQTAEVQNGVKGTDKIPIAMVQMTATHISKVLGTGWYGSGEPNLDPGLN